MATRVVLYGWEADGCLPVQWRPLRYTLAVHMNALLLCFGHKSLREQGGYLAANIDPFLYNGLETVYLGEMGFLGSFSAWFQCRRCLCQAC